MSEQKTISAVDIYNETGRIPCQKCGLDLLESRGCEIRCVTPPCRGMVVTREMLEDWAKAENKTLKLK